MTRLNDLRDGLYEPWTEHDSCGVGFVAHVGGVPDKQIVSDALEILRRMDHRGACGCDPDSGDGAGILMQVPDAFLRQRTAELGFELPAAQTYGAGMVFLPPYGPELEDARTLLEQACAEARLKTLGWRDVPVDTSYCGPSSMKTCPQITQIFVVPAEGANAGIVGDQLEARLYIARKIAEGRAAARGGPIAEHFYVSSLSCRTMVYKGMLTALQVEGFFPDLSAPDMSSAIALVHSRFSTNTMPAWRLAQPFRYVAHNGEINTVRGNTNWMNARQAQFSSEVFGEDMDKLVPVIAPGQSDSAVFDNALELLSQTGRGLNHSAMMMVPEAWEKHTSMDAEKRAFYRYSGCVIEPWDGPASIAFTNGLSIGAVLDRNGLRPSRYCVTKDDRVIMASETGVLDIPASEIVYRERLQPGRMFYVDLEQKRILDDGELKHSVASSQPFIEWVDNSLVELDSLPAPAEVAAPVTGEMLERQQRQFGYSREDLSVLLAPMAELGAEPIGSMGTDTPLACLSDRPQLVFNYFKQLFAQVTNPPIDPIREELIMSLQTVTGRQANLFEETEDHCKQVHLPQPVLTNEELAQLREIDRGEIRSATVSTLFEPSADSMDGTPMEAALKRVCADAAEAVRQGAHLVILSDRGTDEGAAPLPILMAVGAVHHHLIREGLRMRAGIIVESGEPREVMHYCLLTGYGASGINPYLAFDTIADLHREGRIDGVDAETAAKNYVKGVGKGMMKTMSKMGISTLASYRGAQIFEAIGLDPSVIDRCFTGTPSRIRGVGYGVLNRELDMRRTHAWVDTVGRTRSLDPGGQYQWRRQGEYHLFNPETVARLQHAVIKGDYKLFRAYSRQVDKQEKHLCTLRSLLEFVPAQQPIPMEEVEPVEQIVTRFKTGAMSYGSISAEAHETLAIAMNRIGGKSNTGEGGEDPARFTPDANGDLRRSSIKQVASGRFGVTINYLTNADEIQIKMAQGAKPGEGGQLPGHKVDETIARTRHSTPGVGLISPPPHHDIYSIEDLAQLIHDLKNSNPAARISVKLVSEIGVGTVAAGVAKAKADVVLISGHDGGTGASPLSSIKHAGIPWELGLAEAQQVLVANQLRSRVRVETDGQLKTGRDVAIAALLGADEFGFATAALVAEGCIMMRKCHLNTCPVGIATQDERLRAKFTGKPEHVVNFMYYVAEELREIMAMMGFRTVQEMTGRVDRLRHAADNTHWKAQSIDLEPILRKVNMPASVGISGTETQDHGLENALDNELIVQAEAAIKRGENVRIESPITNINRTVCTTLSHELTKAHGAAGLPPYTVQLTFTGSAGQSFGAFMAPGISATIHGDANDYFCKGMSGGQAVIMPQGDAAYTAEDNIIIGNVALYGATAGEVFVRGRAGERFCVRNSGATAVVEGVGDHCCEYMTGGLVVCLGETGRNFAAGMSGGIAFVLDEDSAFASRCNPEMVELLPLEDDADRERLQQLLSRHRQYTGSAVAEKLLADWDATCSKFVKVFPSEYRRVLEEMAARKKAS